MDPLIEGCVRFYELTKILTIKKEKKNEIK